MENRRSFGWSKLSKNHRRYLIVNRSTFLFGAQYAAAVEVQRVIRGFLARKHLKETEPLYQNIVREEQKKKNNEILDKYSDISEAVKLSEESSEDFMSKYAGFIQARVSSVIYRFFSRSIIERKVGLGRLRKENITEISIHTTMIFLTLVCSCVQGRIILC